MTSNFSTSFSAFGHMLTKTIPIFSMSSLICLQTTVGMPAPFTCPMSFCALFDNSATSSSAASPVFARSTTSSREPSRLRTPELARESTWCWMSSHVRRLDTCRPRYCSHRGSSQSCMHAHGNVATVSGAAFRLMAHRGARSSRCRKRDRSSHPCLRNPTAFLVPSDPRRGSGIQRPRAISKKARRQRGKQREGCAGICNRWGA
mmetsp:Transcript_30076/g.82612  ORF Transcript_30076/g.82612 Transcript_30076/m.82612 type:complete len:204 (+) Transcript_30076:353-964(+)